MRKVGLFIIGFVAAIIILNALGPIAGFAISAAITYTGVHFYLKAQTTWRKVVWALVGIAGILTAIANIPALVGIAAVALLYIVYRKWHDASTIITEKENDDPFVNFEKEWSNLTK